MSRKKIISFLAVIVFMFGFTGLAQMQAIQNQINYENKTGNEMVDIEEDIAAEEIAKTINSSGKYEPRIMPGTVFYPLKNFFREAQVLFSKDTDKKINLRLRNANEKILELNALADAGQMDKVAKNLDSYSRELIKMGQLIGKTAGENPQKAEDISQKMLKNQISHHIIGNKLERKAPVEMLADIRESKDKVISTIGTVVSGLGSAEKIEQSTDEDVKKLLSKGTPYKQVYALAALKTIEEKLSPEAKEAVNKVNDKYTKTFNINLDRMNPENQEKFVQYASKNSGDTVVQMEIIDDLSVTNTNDRSYKNIDKVKNNLYSDFNIKLSEAQSKAPEAVSTMVKRLENGDIKDLRIIKEMEQNINPILVTNIIEKTKETSLENLSNRLVVEDEKIFLEHASENTDLRQLAVLNDIEKKISIADKPKLEKAREEIIKKMDYSVSLVASELESANLGIITQPQISQTEIMITDCISDKKCFNTKNISPEDAKIIEENKQFLGEPLARKLQEINTVRVIDMIKNTENIESLRKLENKVKANLPEQFVNALTDEFTTQTVIINTRAQDISSPETSFIRPEPVKEVLPSIGIAPKTEIIELCAKEYMPVCGTDNKTYLNNCFAEKVPNVKIQYKGICNSANVPATTAYPTDILCNMQEFSPVCGTDKITYRSRCVAELFAKVKVDYDGACVMPLNLLPPSPTPLPTNIAEPTAIIQPTIREPKIIIDSITTIPTTNSISCSLIYSPVCGYDGQTYSNRCVAEKINGVPVKYEGKCTETILAPPATIIPPPPATPTYYCGDKICNNNETYATCRTDCGITTVETAPITTTPPSVNPPTTVIPYCGDRLCNNNETYTTCPADCEMPAIAPPPITIPPTTLVPTTPTYYCGDNVCNNGETYLTCRADCGITTVEPVPIKNTIILAPNILTELKPDLRPSGLAVTITKANTTTSITRNLLNFSVTVTNTGDRNTEIPVASALKIDLFNDGTLNIGDTGVQINPLSTGNNQQLSWSKYLEGSVGTHKAEVCVDMNGQINEKDENNNCTSINFTIYPEVKATITNDTILYPIDGTMKILRDSNPLNRVVRNIGSTIKSFFLFTAKAMSSF